jgi:hypothetical protein
LPWLVVFLRILFCLIWPSLLCLISSSLVSFYHCWGKGLVVDSKRKKEKKYPMFNIYCCEENTV